MSEKLSDPVSLRFPATLREQLDVEAKKNGRSLNAEIRMRLEWSFDGGFSGEPSSSMLAAEVEMIRSELRGEVSSLRAALAEIQQRLAALERVR